MDEEEEEERTRSIEKNVKNLERNMLGDDKDEEYDGEG